MQVHIDKINEMASVMRKAIEVDEGRTCEDEERIKQLEVHKKTCHRTVEVPRMDLILLLLHPNVWVYICVSVF